MAIIAVLAAVGAAIAAAVKGIFDTAKKLIDWSFQTLPKPVLFVIFMALFLVIANFVVPFFLNVTGTYCVNDRKLVGKPADVFNNIKMWQLTAGFAAPDETEDPRIWTTTTIEGTRDVEWSCFVPQLLANGSWDYWYDGAFCTNCTTVQIDKTGAGDYANVCSGDAYPITNETKTWLQKFQCESQDTATWFRFACEPPTNFYYENSTKTYVCDASWCVNTTEYDIFIQEARKKGFAFLPVVEGESPELIGVGCSKNNEELQVAGTNIFGYGLWIMLTLFVIIIWLWYKFK